MSQPGIIFGLNDSGNGPYLFAFDSSGAERGMWEIVGAQNRDWEAASLGPCSRNSSTGSCLYVGDVGDNDSRNSRLTVYRFPEPRVPSSGDSIPSSPIPVRDVARLDFVYSDRPHDVEAMYVGRDGSVFLITKRRLLDAERRPRPALVFRIPPSAWDSSGIVTAALVDSLPIIPGERKGGQISDAALSPDGKMLAVRTYADVFVFAVDSTSGLPRRDIAPGSCVIAGLREKQGEGIGWWWDQRRLVLTSEGRNSPLYVIDCPLPESQGGGVAFVPVDIRFLNSVIARTRGPTLSWSRVVTRFGHILPRRTLGSQEERCGIPSSQLHSYLVLVRLIRRRSPASRWFPQIR